MLKLQKDQINAFRLQGLQLFVAAAIRHLRKELADQTARHTDAQLEQRIRTAIPRASKYGLKTQQEIVCFIDVSFLLGEHFDTNASQPWATALLSSEKLPSRDRANLLLATACSVYRELMSNQE